MAIVKGKEGENAEDLSYLGIYLFVLSLMLRTCFHERGGEGGGDLSRKAISITSPVLKEGGKEDSLFIFLTSPQEGEERGKVSFLLLTFHFLTEKKKRGGGGSTM